MNNQLTPLQSIGIILLGVFVGVFGTHYLIVLGFSAVLASASCGLLASAIIWRKKAFSLDLAIAIYCGSFAGMGAVFESKELVLLAILVVLLILISNRLFVGFGGKLGFIAYVSSVIAELIIVLLGSKQLENFSLSSVFTQFDPIAKWSIMAYVFVASALGFYTTVYLHHSLGKSAIFSSSFPSFILALVLYFIDVAYEDLIVVTFFSATFAGMLAEDLIPKRHFPFLVLTHCLTIILLKKNLGSYGGALGTMAFFTVFLMIQIDLMLKKIIKGA